MLLLLIVALLFLKGTRMWRRGADSDGFVANFVESEQIMLFSGHTASFVQVILYNFFSSHLQTHIDDCLLSRFFPLLKKYKA